jgi:membrane dipeptidase
MKRRSFLAATAAAPLILGLARQVKAVASTRPLHPFLDGPNEAIDKAWQAGLDALQPTPKQLEHGLELHKASLVFDTYGFSPRASLDNDALKTAIEAGAGPVELADLREEMGMTRCVTDLDDRAEYLQAWAASGLTGIFQNAGEESQAPLRVMRRLARFTYVTDMLRDHLFKAVTPDDIEAAKRQGKRCLYFSANGVPLAQQWEGLSTELEFVRVFFQLGIRMMHMTYNRRNMLGDGCAEPGNAGLSDFGRAAVKEMNRVGVIPDVAHSGWQTSLETAQAAQKPMVASHTCCDALHHHIRAKPDNVIKAIADTGGLVGICAISHFLGGKGDITALVDHLEYIVRKFGPDYTAIGTDIAYAVRGKPKAVKLPTAPRGKPRWESFWPAGSLGGGEKPSMAWTNWPLFTVAMVQRGFSDANIQKILSGNLLRVARANLAVVVPGQKKQ